MGWCVCVDDGLVCVVAIVLARVLRLLLMVRFVGKVSVVVLEHTMTVMSDVVSELVFCNAYRTYI